MSLFTAVGIMKGKRPVLIYFIVKQTMRYRIPVLFRRFLGISILQLLIIYRIYDYDMLTLSQ
jgi:hypothetical protein